MNYIQKQNVSVYAKFAHQYGVRRLENCIVSKMCVCQERTPSLYDFHSLGTLKTHN